MFELASGNLLDAEVEALVNTVNCVGIMGKGIALEFKKVYPANFKVYEHECRERRVRPGRMLVVETLGLGNPKYIINFPTKHHWKGKSRLEYIEAGLDDLVKQIQEHEIKSIAVPALGCGNGGLDWADVEPRIRAAFAGLPEDVRVLVYAPEQVPAVPS